MWRIGAIHTPFVSGLYDNAQLLYDTFTGNNWKAKTDYEKAQMGRKLIMMETQQAYIRLREQDSGALQAYHGGAGLRQGQAG